MVSSKYYDIIASGGVKNFIPEFIIKSEQYCRVYNYVYDPLGVEGDVDTNTGLFIRVVNSPNSNDLVTLEKWTLVDNYISFYDELNGPSKLVIEVATTPEELGDALAGAAADRAELAADEAEASAASALVSENAAAADLVLTNADAASTAADVVSTNADAASTAADLVLTNADVVSTNADVISTNADAASTAADAISTAADVVSTNADAASTAADVITTTTNVTNSQLDAWEAEAEAMTADSYANQVVDVFVNEYTSNGDGTFTSTPTIKYSSLHYAVKSGEYSPTTNKSMIPISYHTAGALAVSNTDPDVLVGTTHLYTGTGLAHDEVTGLNTCDFRVSGNGSGFYLVRADIGAGVVLDNPTELVTGDNSTFDATLGDWTSNSAATIALVSNQMQITTVGTDGYAKLDNVIPAAGKYYVEFDLTGVTTSVAVGVLGNFATPVNKGDGKYSVVIESTGAGYIIVRGNVADTSICTIDNFRAVRIEEPGETNWQSYDSTSGETPRGLCRVHIKSRSTVRYHNVYDGLRGSDNQIYTNDTLAETNDPRMDFISSGITLTSGQNEVNENLVTYVLEQTHFCTHVKWGTTNHGKFYIEAYNPVTGEGFIYYTGSGTAGHELPHSQSVALDYVEGKNLTSALSWGIHALDNTSYLNFDDGATSAGTYFPNISNASIGVDGVNLNELNSECIMYYKSKSETYTTGTYIGTGASGNKIVTRDVNGVARKPRRVVIKSLSAVGNWGIHDTTRGEGKIEFNTSDVEYVADIIDIVVDGIIHKTAVADYNELGIEYLYQVEFDTNSDGGGSKADLPSLTSTVQGTDLNIAYSDGYGANGAVNTNELIAGDTAISNAIFTDGDGMYHISKIEGGAFVASKDEPIFQLPATRTVAGYNPDIYDTDGKQYGSTNGDEKVVNGTFDTDLTGWTTSGTVIVSSTNSSLYWDRNNGGLYDFYQEIPTTIGEELTLSIDLLQVPLGGVGRLYIGTSQGLNDLGFIAYNIDELGTKSINIIPSSSSIFIHPAYGTALSGVAIFDNISLFETNIEKDTQLSTRTPLNTIVEVAQGQPVDLHEWKAPSINTDKIAVQSLNTTSLVVADEFDLGQSWVDVTADMGLGIDYLNDTGKPISVHVKVYNSTGTSSAILAIVDGIDVDRSIVLNDNYSLVVSFTVPSGSVYRVSSSGGVVDGLYWSELR